MAQAAARQRLEQQQDEGKVDRLTPELIDFLVTAFKADDLELDDEARWLPRSSEARLRRRDAMRESAQEDLEEALELRALGDIDRIMHLWSDTAHDNASAHGYNISRTDETFPRYARAFHDALIELWQAQLRRDDGEHVPAPVVPPRPRRQDEALAFPSIPSASFQDIVSDILDNPSKPMSPTTKEATRTALRFFREANGTPLPHDITRMMVADWIDLLARRPAKLPLGDRDVPLPALVERYEGRTDIPRLSSKTLEQHRSSLAARWKQAAKRGRIDREAPNPFSDHDIDRTPKRRKAKGFSEAELRSIFDLPIFTKGERPKGGKGEASFWIALFMLHTGARPEEVAQLIVDDIFQDPKSGRWAMRYTDEGEHEYKVHQRLKTSRVGSGNRTFPIPRPLLDLGLLAYRKDLIRSGESVLFPKLRTKGSRMNLYPGFGEWWSNHLKENGVVLEGTGRQPMREFRHTWSTAARRCGVAKEAMAYLQGHGAPDATAGDDYGSLDPLGLQMDKIAFEELDLTRVLPWSAASADDR